MQDAGTKRSLRAAVKKLADNRTFSGVSFRVEVSSDGTSYLYDHRPMQYGTTLAYTDGVEAVFVANHRLETYPELLDTLVDTLRDTGYFEPHSPDNGWSTFYR